MNGNEHRGVVIQERDRHLLRELAVMRVIDREQAKTVARFGSASRTNRRLHQLTRSGLLRRFFLGTSAGGRKALYSLSATGARSVGVPHRGLQRRKDEVLATDLFVQHQLTVNDTYCTLKYGSMPSGEWAFRRWISFSQPLSSGVRLIPDGYLELATPSGTMAAFLEVDRGPEILRVWQDKVRNYLQFAMCGEFERRFEQPRFRVLVIAPSERRMHSIRKTAAAITQKLFWFSTLELIRDGGFFRQVWMRPVGDERQPLLQELL